MKRSNRKTCSDKFPLTLHPSGHYCKKIKGDIYYFGSGRKQALENYLDRAIFLYGYNNAMQKSVKPKILSLAPLSLFKYYEIRK